MLQSVWEFMVIAIVGGIIIPAVSNPIETCGVLVAAVTLSIYTA